MLPNSSQVKIFDQLDFLKDKHKSLFLTRFKKERDERKQKKSLNPYRNEGLFEIGEFFYSKISTNSTLNINSELGGMTAPAPCFPYPK